MKEIFNAQKISALSTEERETLIALIKEAGVGETELIEGLGQENRTKKQSFTRSLTKDTLLQNLTELQRDGLELEEQIVKLRDRNDYLEEKIGRLRDKAGVNVTPPKAKRGSSFSLGDSSLNSALVEIINSMESKTRGSMGFSLSRAKRIRKDRVLISNSEYFDKKYVATQLGQLGLQVNDPLEFFVSFGAALELSPSEKFDTKSYLAMNPDVKDSGINPLLHYIKHGKAEGRVLI